MAVSPLGELGLLARQQPGAALQERDAHPEAHEALRELDADRPAADHHDAARRLVQREDALARQRHGVAGPSIAEWRGPAAGREQDVAGCARFPDADRRRRGQTGGAAEHVDAHRREALRVVVGGRDCAGIVRDPRPDAVRVCARPNSLQATGVGVADRVRGPRRRQQRLGRHAAGPQAIAAGGGFARRRGTPRRARGCEP